MVRVTVEAICTMTMAFAPTESVGGGLEMLTKQHDYDSMGYVATTYSSYFKRVFSQYTGSCLY